MDSLSGPWAQQMGITIHKDIDITTRGQHGTQGLATSYIPSDTVLCSIPFSACITPRLASACFNVPFHLICDRDLESTILAAYLLHERHTRDSRWAAYLAALPLTFSSPLWWTTDDLAWLVGTNLQGEVSRREAAMQTQIQALQAVLGRSGGMYPIDEWKWAMEVIRSRSFPSSLINDTSTPSHPILLPVLDTFNHKSPHPITWKTHCHDDVETISFISGSGYAQGEEIYNNYGGKCNEEFLMSYGFCIPGLSSDTMFLKVAGGSDKMHVITRQDLLPATLLQEIHDLLLEQAGCQGEHDLHSDGLMAQVRGLQCCHGALYVKLSTLESTVQTKEPTNTAQVNAKIYRTGQIELCRSSMKSCEKKLVQLLDGEDVYTLNDVLETQGLSQAVEDTFGVQCVQDAEETQLVQVLFAIFIWHKTREYARDDTSRDEGDLTEEIDDLWEQIESCTTSNSATFGNLTRQTFGRAFVLQDKSCFDFKQDLYWLDPFRQSQIQ